MAGEQYYALCVEEEDGGTEITFFELRREALQGALGISLYTSPDGQLQRRHLREEDDHVVIVAKSTRDLLQAMTTGVPSTVFVDAESMAGSVFSRPCLRKISVCRYVNPGSYGLRSPICTEFAQSRAARG